MGRGRIWGKRGGDKGCSRWEIRTGRKGGRGKERDREREMEKESGKFAVRKGKKMDC